MKQIKQLAEMICEELDDACGYAKEAMCCKDSDRELAEMFYKLSSQELEHADMEHAQAVRLIKSYDGTVPAVMQAIWDWEHQKMIEQKAEIKALLSMYKG